MSNAANYNYGNLDLEDRPYSDNLERTESIVGGEIAEGITGTESEGVEGGTPTITTGGALKDIWLETWMKSRGYKPKSQGFLIDGLAGYIECMKLFVGTGGIVGGKIDIPDETSTNSFHVDSNGNVWLGANVADGYASAPTYFLSDGSAVVDGYPVITKGTFGGDGSDGDKVVSADEELNDAYKTYQFDDLTIDATKTLSFGSNYQNKLIRIKVKGNLVINGTLDVSGMGGAGGTGGAGPMGNPTNGTAGILIWDALVHYGTKGGGGGTGGGGGGGGAKTAGTDGNVGGAGGVAISPFDAFFNQYTRSVFVCCSSGGGGGDSNVGGGGGDGGNGGKGGGGLYIEVNGNVTCGASAVITTAGDNGSDGTGGTPGGGGGGGAGGFVYFLYNGTLTDSGLTITVSGGTGGSGNGGGDGGVGGNGDYILQKNVSFA